MDKKTIRAIIAGIIFFGSYVIIGNIEAYGTTCGRLQDTIIQGETVAVSKAMGYVTGVVDEAGATGKICLPRGTDAMSMLTNVLLSMDEDGETPKCVVDAARKVYKCE